MDLEKLAPRISALLLTDKWHVVRNFTVELGDEPGEPPWFTCEEQLFKSGGPQAGMPSETTTLAGKLTVIVAVRLKDSSG
jgi:hypothetical protein